MAGHGRDPNVRHHSRGRRGTSFNERQRLSNDIPLSLCAHSESAPESRRRLRWEVHQPAAGVMLFAQADRRPAIADRLTPIQRF